MTHPENAPQLTVTSCLNNLWANIRSKQQQTVDTLWVKAFWMVITVVEFKLIWLLLESLLVYFHEGNSCLENARYSRGWKFPGRRLLTMMCWWSTDRDGQWCHMRSYMYSMLQSLKCLCLFVQTSTGSLLQKKKSEARRLEFLCKAFSTFCINNIVEWVSNHQSSK